MGCIISHDDKDAKEASHKIDAFLRQEQKKYAKEIKLLLLGAGESGKSTIVKQMKIINENGYTPEECAHYRGIVFSNTVQSMLTLIRAMGQLDIPFEDDETCQAAAQIVQSLAATLDSSASPSSVAAAASSLSDNPLSGQLGDALQTLWKDSGVQQCLARSREFQLNDSAVYYLSSLSRLAQPDYSPTQQDVLRTRVKTSGITEIVFTYRNVAFRMVDVGGQRSERRKWIHCFDNVMAIIFVVALSEYDLQLAEDASQNRMTESMQLFAQICNNQYFVATSLILFFNKSDLFRDKLAAGSPLRLCFPEYDGPNSCPAAYEYIEAQFLALNRTGSSGTAGGGGGGASDAIGDTVSSGGGGAGSGGGAGLRNNSGKKAIYPHETCATDTTNMATIFDRVTDIIMRSILIDTNLY